MCIRKQQQAKFFPNICCINSKIILQFTCRNISLYLQQQTAHAGKNYTTLKVKVKSTHAHKRASVDAHPPLLGLEPVSVEPLMSVTCGQCNTRPMVTFPAARHYCPLAGTRLYCLVTEAHVC